MAEALIVMFSFAPVVIVPPEVFDTANEYSLNIYGGMQTPNRDLRAGFEFGTKLEFRIVHPYLLRFGIDYSEAEVTDPFAPRGRKSSMNFNLDALAYRGRKGLISYVGLGVAFGVNNLQVASETLDSLETYLGVTQVSLKNSFGYRILMGLRFEELFVFEVSFQQANPDYVYRRDFSNGEYSLEEIDGTFSVARVNLGYLFKL